MGNKRQKEASGKRERNPWQILPVMCPVRTPWAWASFSGAWAQYRSWLPGCKKVAKRSVQERSWNLAELWGESRCKAMRKLTHLGESRRAGTRERRQSSSVWRPSTAMWAFRLRLFHKEPQDLATTDKRVCYRNWACSDTAKMAREFQGGKRTHKWRWGGRKKKKGTVAHIVLELSRNPKRHLSKSSPTYFYPSNYFVNPSTTTPF